MVRSGRVQLSHLTKRWTGTTPPPPVNDIVRTTKPTLLIVRSDTFSFLAASLRVADCKFADTSFVCWLCPAWLSRFAILAATIPQICGMVAASIANLDNHAGHNQHTNEVSANLQSATRKEAAKKLNVSERTINRVGLVVRTMSLTGGGGVVPVQRLVKCDSCTRPDLTISRLTGLFYYLFNIELHVIIMYFVGIFIICKLFVTVWFMAHYLIWGCWYRVTIQNRADLWFVN